MLRMSAAGELFQVSVPLVVKLFVYADLAGVVAIDRRILDRAKESLFNGLRGLLVPADLLQYLDLLIDSRLGKGFSKLAGAHLVYCGQTFAPPLFCGGRRFADDKIDVLIYSRRLCTGRVIIGGNDPLGHFKYGFVLFVGEELQRLSLRGRGCLGAVARVVVRGQFLSA